MKYKIINNNSNSESVNNSQAEDPRWRLDEIALTESTITQIDEMVAYVHNREKLLIDWEFKRFLKFGTGLSVNFFGPSGTGKSITAEAIAQRLEKKILRVNYDELESELVGRTSKNLMGVFKIAEETSSVIFFDEADALLSKRLSNLSHAADHGVNMTKSVLLKKLDKFSGITIFATNDFDNYDNAFIRRILFNIPFSLPDLRMRTQLWQFHLSEKVPRSITYERASELSDGLSGGDIRNITIRLGLRLLVGSEELIDEPLFKAEVARYFEILKSRKPRGLPNQPVVESVDSRFV